MRYILMCGGKYSRWKTPRQLLQIHGEPIIARTIRLLKSEGVSEIYISANDERFAKYAPLLKHENKMTVDCEAVTGAWVDAFYPTEEPACYLFGDVVFSKAAIHKIVNTETNDILFFGSTPPFSPLFIKEWAEPFAFKVVNQKRFREAIDYVKNHIGTPLFRRHPIAWELWQILTGRDPLFTQYDKVTPINDFTCDIDSPEDIAKIERVLCEF